MIETIFVWVLQAIFAMAPYAYSFAFAAVSLLCFVLSKDMKSFGVNREVGLFKNAALFFGLISLLSITPQTQDWMPVKVLLMSLSAWPGVRSALSFFRWRKDARGRADANSLIGCRRILKALELAPTLSAVALYDPDYRIIWHNRTYVELFEFEPVAQANGGTLVGMQHNTLWPESADTGSRSDWGRIIRDVLEMEKVEHSKHGDIAVTRTSGKEVMLEWVCFPLSDGTCVYGFGLDHTEQNLADEEKDRLREAIEKQKEVNEQIRGELAEAREQASLNVREAGRQAAVRLASKALSLQTSTL